MVKRSTNMNKTVVINVVGLTKRLIGEHTPFIKSFLEKGKSSFIRPVIPAVTCTAQSTYLTGEWPSNHGIVGNGWYFNTSWEVNESFTVGGYNVGRRLADVNGDGRDDIVRVTSRNILEVNFSSGNRIELKLEE